MYVKFISMEDKKMENSEVKDFIAYEYLSLNVKEDNITMYIDCYENFGWVVVSNGLNTNHDYYINHQLNTSNSFKINFKRDRKIKSKKELNNLQRKMETSLNNLEKLKKEPNNMGTIASLIVGFIGTIFMSLSVFSITINEPLIVLCVIFGVIGLIGWILPYFVYKKIKFKKTNKNNSLIEEQYDELNDICEQANNLLK